MGEKDQQTSKRTLLDTLKLIIQLGRLKFLLYSPLCFSFGLSVATFSAAPSHSNAAIQRFLFCQFFGWVCHLMTHYFNEYYDYEADVANQFPSPWTGGSRVLVHGQLKREHTLRIATAFITVASILALFLPTLEIKALAFLLIFLGWQYSAPPFRFVSLGLGEVTVALVLNVVGPLWAYLLYATPQSQPHLLLLALPTAINQVARMTVMTMPDRIGDALADKNTIVVRLGAHRCVQLHALALLLEYTIIVLLFILSFTHPHHFLPLRSSLLIMLLTVPMAAWLVYRMLWRQEWKDLQSFFDIPYWSTIHNSFITAAPVLGLILDDSLPFWSWTTQLRSFSLYLYFGALLLPIFRSYLGVGSSPKVSSSFDQNSKAAEIARWNELLARPDSLMNLKLHAQ